jgi:DNA-binding response OmpR family regulator
VTSISEISTLVVETNPGMRTQLRNMLALAGITRIEFAVSAGVAVRKLREQRFHLILCEYHLGDGQDGQHLLEDLRHNKIIPLETLFLMVTGERQYERVISAAELAPNDYILKPFAAETLLARIQRALQKREALLPVYQAINMGDTPGAIERCIEGEHAFPIYAIDFLRLHAELCTAIGQVEEAQALYQRILEFKVVPWARLGHAKTQLIKDKFEAAEQHLNKKVKENANLIEA